MALQNTTKGAALIERALEGARHLFFIGIGGVHMASLALYARRAGYTVSGSDTGGGAALSRLAAAGVTVYPTHDAAQLRGVDAVIYTLAIGKDNPEYAAAVRHGLPLFSRADFLGFVMSRYPVRIGVAGSHGKSTVTAMLAEIFSQAGRAPTVFCGAPLAPSREAVLLGGEREFIFEACEYENSFLCFSPTLAVILNVAHDHADFFKDVDDVRASFARFAALPTNRGRVLYAAGDENAVLAVKDTPATRYSFGEGGDFAARDVEMKGGCAAFSFTAFGRVLGRITLRVAGRHNLQNALAAAGAAYLSGIAPAVITRALSDFRGAARRMEYKGQLCGARVFDDYAHHPDEIAATLCAAREMAGTGRLFAVFQSHTYTRTRAFLGEIAAALRLADRVLVADIFPARERDTLGMSAAVIARAVGECASAEGSFDAIAATLSRELSAGDLCVVMGAGDIDRLFGRFSKKDFTL